MKTIKEIKKEEADLHEQIRTADHNETKRITKRLQLLRICRLYLETKPSEKSLRGQLDDLNHNIEIIDERFSAWSSGRTGSDTGLRRQYAAITERSKLKTQINTLTYLLS